MAVRLLAVLSCVALSACSGASGTPGPGAAVRSPAAPTSASAPSAPDHGLLGGDGKTTSVPASPSATSVVTSALWPETDLSVAPKTFPTWRNSATSTVSHFASTVLGWQHPVVRPIRSRFRVETRVRAFAVTPRPGAQPVEVHAATVFDRQHWSVTYMWGFGAQEAPASLSINRAHGDVRLGYWNHAASARLLLIYGRHQLKRSSSTSAHWAFPLTFPINVNGAVIVLFKGYSGEVFTGWGTTVPAGPFAAG